MSASPSLSCQQEQAVMTQGLDLTLIRDLPPQTVLIPEWSFSVCFTGPISIESFLYSQLYCVSLNTCWSTFQRLRLKQMTYIASLWEAGYHFQFCIYYLFISFLKNQQTYVKFSTSNNIIMSLPVHFLLHATNWKQLFHFYNYFKYGLECVYMCFIFLL